MKVLIVTGKLAEKSIRLQISKIKHKIDILALPVNVASFITPSYAVKALQDMDLKDYDLIILPGAVLGDVTPVEIATGVKTFKGPLYASDLPLVLSNEIELSKTIPASDLIDDLRYKEAMKELMEVDSNWEEILIEHKGIRIGKGKTTVPVGDKFPMRVIAEIVNAPLLSFEEIKNKALYYETQEADIIDIGMLAGNPRQKEIPKIIDVIRETVNLPLSIDTLDPSEIKSSVDAGIDLILSLDAGNMDAVAQYISDEVVVVLPSDMRRGLLPKKVHDRVEALERNIESAMSYGINNIVADLIVEPLLKPGLLNPLRAYQLYHNKHPEIPLLFGIGNAVELIDADSPGVSATLSALARESGANLLHVPEHSIKTRGNVNEMVKASRMMFIAQRKDTIPKDLGLDLLILKEKRWNEESYQSVNEKDSRVLHGIPNEYFKPDESGWFKIQVDRVNEEIVVLHYTIGSKKPSTIIKGTTVSGIYKKIIEKKLITKLDHAAYLGKELEKASIALKLGRSYRQEESLFK